MKKFLKIGCAVIFAIVALVMIIALFLPGTWKVEESIVIHAPKEKIFPYIADLKKWEDWTPWTVKFDPSLQRKYSEKTRGVDATSEWKGDKMGSGMIRVKTSDPESGISYDLHLEECFTSKGGIRFEEADRGTKVFWYDEGDLGWFLPARYFISMIENQVSPDFKKGLENLKTVVEKENPQMP